jgi:hypothetical protein
VNLCTGCQATVDQERTAAREWGVQVATVWVQLRRQVPWWLAARLTLAYARSEGSAVVHVYADEDE